MSLLVIRCTMGKMMSKMPRKIFINNKFVGILQDSTATVEIPSGEYLITLQSMIPFISASTMIKVNTGVTTHIDYSDREKVWNILFTIDIALSMVQLFLTLPEPWNWIYSILTNTFFVVWLIYEWRIRKRYYKTDIYYTLQ